MECPSRTNAITLCPVMADIKDPMASIPAFGWRSFELGWAFDECGFLAERAEVLRLLTFGDIEESFAWTEALDELATDFRWTVFLAPALVLW
jgi:hypothetical protein